MHRRRNAARGSVDTIAMNMRYSLLPLLLLLALTTTQAQPQVTEDGTIYFTNPSFEDYARVASAPRGWTDCSFIGESPVDIQPDPTKEFEVVKPAYDKNTYVGMVTRDNETYERIAQRMSNSMEAGTCYELRVHLARSELYVSQSKMTRQQENYVTPVKLRFRGGYDLCDYSGPILGETALVSNWDWQEYRVKLEPEQEFTHILLEVYYKQPTLFPYNGNVLVDNLQPLRVVACDEDINAADRELIATNEPEEEEVTPSVETPAAPASQPAETSPPDEEEPQAPVVELGKTRGELKIGQIFEIEDITFKANSADLEADSERALTQISKFLKTNRDVVVEIGGHASHQAGPVYANRISQARAEAVIAYLRSQNIGGGQLLPKGYGRSRPVCTEATDECNQRNQRVEVKIMKIRNSR